LGKQETGKIGDWRPEAGGRKDKRREKGDRRRKDKRRRTETGDGRRETGERRPHAKAPRRQGIKIGDRGRGTSGS